MILSKHLSRRHARGNISDESLVNLLQSNGLGKRRATEIATKLKSMALGFESDNKHSVASDYYQAAADWFKSSGETDKFVEMILRKAESLVKKGDDQLSSEEPGYLDAVLSYEEAIDTLYRLKERSNIPKSELSTYQVNERIDELMLRQEDLWGQAIDGMEPITVDITERFNQRLKIACAAVTGKGYIEALYKFVNLRSMIDVDELTSRAVKRLRTYNHLSISANPSVADPAVHAQVVEDYMFYVSFFVSAALLPALKVIRQEHCLEPELFFSIAERSLMVPDGRAQAFGKGLLAGYKGDFEVAFQVLSPQIEHLIRCRLRRHKVNTRYRKNGVDEERLLAWLLYHEKTEEIFGKNLLFELRTLFHPHRNDQAHGLIDDTSSPSPCDVYIWWLMLRLVFNSSNFQSEGESPNV